VQNISTNSSVNNTAWDIQGFERELGDVFLGQLAGSTQLGGLFGLTIMGYMLYKADVGEDIGAAVMIPTVFFLASEGFLPYGQGIIYAMILAVSGIFIFGLIKYADR
jgi:hypothetical protein